MKPTQCFFNLIFLLNCALAKLDKSEKQNLQSNLKVLKEDFDNVLKNAEDFTADFFGQIFEASQNAIDRTYGEDLNWNSSEDVNVIGKSKNEIPKLKERVRKSLKSSNKPATDRKKRSIQTETVSSVPNEQFQNAYNDAKYYNNLPQMNANTYTSNNNNPSQRNSYSSVRNAEIKDNCNEKTQREYELEKKKLTELKTEVKRLNDVLVLIKDQHRILEKFNQTQQPNIEVQSKINVDTIDKSIPTHKEIDRIKQELTEAVKTINHTSKILEFERIKENNLEDEMKKQQEEIHFLKIMISHLFIRANDKSKEVNNVSNNTKPKVEVRDADDEMPILGSVHHMPKSLPIKQNQSEAVADDDRVREASPDNRARESDNGDMAKLLQLLTKNKKEEKESKSNEDDLKSKLEELQKQMKEKREQEQLIEQIKQLNNAKPQSKTENSGDSLKKLIAALNKPQSKADNVEIDLKQLQAAIRKLRPIDQTINFGNSFGGKDESQDFQASLNQLITQESGGLGGLSTATIQGPLDTPKITPQELINMYRVMHQQGSGNAYPFYGVPSGYPPANFPPIYPPYQQYSSEAYPASDDKISAYSSNYNNAFKPRGYGSLVQPENQYNYEEPSASDSTAANYGNLINSLLSTSYHNAPSTSYYNKLDNSYKPDTYFSSYNSYPANYKTPNGYGKSQIYNDQHTYQPSLAHQQSYMGSSDTVHPGSSNTYLPQQPSYPNQYQQFSGYVPPQNTIIPASYQKSPSSGYSSPQNSVSQQSKYNGKQFFPNMHDGQDISEGNSPSSDYNHQNTAPASLDQSQYSTPNADNKYQLVADLKSQIDGLENVIKSLNTGDYGQKGEDRQTIVTLEQRINDLKGVINSLNQPSSYSGDVPSKPLPAPSSPGYGQHGGGAYGHPGGAAYSQSGGGAYGQSLPNNQPPRGAPSRVVYNGVASAGAAPPPAPVSIAPPQNTPYKSRKRRQVLIQPSDLFGRVTDVNQERLNSFSNQPRLTSLKTRNQESPDPTYLESNMVPLYNVQPLENQFSSEDKRSPSQQERFGRPYLNNQISPGPDALSQISALFQRFVDENVTRAADENEQNYLKELQTKLDDLKTELERKSEPRAYEYPSYGGVTQSPVLYKINQIQTVLDNKKQSVESLKQDIFTNIVVKILDKIINSLPTVLTHIFGSFTSQLVNDKGDYSYGPIQKIAGNMGIFGFLPMIVLKLIDSFSTLFKALRKNSFFKQFLLPGTVLLLVGGAVLFLFWFLQGDNNDYKPNPSQDYYKATSSNPNYYGPPIYQNQNQYAYGDISSKKSHYLN